MHEALSTKIVKAIIFSDKNVCIFREMGKIYLVCSSSAASLRSLRASAPLDTFKSNLGFETPKEEAGTEKKNKNRGRKIFLQIFLFPESVSLISL